METTATHLEDKCPNCKEPGFVTDLINLKSKCLYCGWEEECIPPMKNPDKDNVVVTGGAGFIGSHLVDRLIEKGYNVTIIDDLSSGKVDNINPKANFFRYDISELKFMEKVDYVFHLAAIARVPYSIAHPTITHKVNITGTYNVLKAALDAGVRKVIFASSSSVYGDQELPLREEAPARPKSPYAYQKFVGEGYMRLFNEVYSLPTVSLRFFNVYGKRAVPDSEYSLVIGKFLRMKREKEPLTIFGDGEQSRDFTYVDDIVSALILTLENPVENEVINLCNGRNVTVNRIADLIGGEKKYLPPRKGDVQHTLGDNSKAYNLLGWEPVTQIEEGIKMTEE